MWFTETPWPPILLFVCGAVVLGILWSQAQRTVYLAGIAGLLLLSGGTYAVEQMIVTDRERLEFSTVDIVRQFQLNNRDATLAYISESPQALTLRALAAAAIDNVDISPDVHVTDIQVTMLAEGTRGSVHFRVNGTISLKGHGNAGHHPLRFRALWQQEPAPDLSKANANEKVWRMLEIEDLDPITGRSLNRFHKVQTGA